MTENEAKQWLKHTRAYQHKCDNCEYIDIKGACNEECKDFYDMAIKALEEIQEYREIGTVKEILIRETQFKKLSKSCISDWKILREYQAIGTIEEFKALKEKSVAKKPTQTTEVFDKESYVGLIGKCPNCGGIVSEDMFVCEDCLQVLDWEGGE